MSLISGNCVPGKIHPTFTSGLASEGHHAYVSWSPVPGVDTRVTICTSPCVHGCWGPLGCGSGVRSSGGGSARVRNVST